MTEPMDVSDAPELDELPDVPVTSATTDYTVTIENEHPGEPAHGEDDPCEQEHPISDPEV